MTTTPKQPYRQDSPTSVEKSGVASSVARQHGVEPRQAGEGPVARAIEQQTARLPSDTWLWAAGGSIALSL